MTDALALRPSALPNIATAMLPETYERAKTALATCDRLDECKDWADKAAALASYAKQADDQTLHQLATRISARAIRRAGDLLEELDGQGSRTDLQLPAGDHRKLTRREAADAAGMSEHQEKQAVRVARVPAETFEALVESEAPPTVTALAALGTATKPAKVAPPGFADATLAIDTVRQFAAFCIDHEAAFIAGGIYGYEVVRVRADVAVVTAWLERFRTHLNEEAAC